METTRTPGFAPIRIFKVIWTALFASQFFYGYVLFTILARGWERTEARWIPNFQDPVEAVVAGAGIAAAFASIFIPPFIVSAIGGASSAEAPGADQVPSRLFPAFIVKLALNEAVCLCGFALAVTRRTPELFIPFAAIGIALYAKCFPAGPKKIAADLWR